MLPGNALLKFKVPEVEEIEVVFIRLEDGTIVARTVQEVERLKALEEEEEEEAPE